MNRNDIQLLFEYDRWANNRVLEAASALSVEQFTRDLGGSFRSVRDTLLHILGGEWGWLAYWRQPSHTARLLTDLRTRLDNLFHPDAFPNVAAVRLKWAEIEKEQTEFVNRLTEAALAKMLPVREKELSLGHLMQHLANHSTYHRGQIALMMRQLDAGKAASTVHDSAMRFFAADVEGHEDFDGDAAPPLAQVIDANHSAERFAIEGAGRV